MEFSVQKAFWVVNTYTEIQDTYVKELDPQFHKENNVSEEEIERRAHDIPYIPIFEEGLGSPVVCMMFNHMVNDLNRVNELQQANLMPSTTTIENLANRIDQLPSPTRRTEVINRFVRRDVFRRQRRL